MKPLFFRCYVKNNESFHIRNNSSHLNQDIVLHPSVIQDKEDVFLIDCGYEGSLGVIEKELARKGFQLKDLTGVIISHDDIDHIGGLYELKAANPHIKVLASSIEAPYLAGEIKSLGLKQAEDLYNTLPEEFKSWALTFQNSLKAIKRIPVDVTLDFDCHLSENIRIINTPGHTPGHISIYIPTDKILIACDAIVVENGELEIANPQFTLDIKQAIESIKKISTLAIDELFCYHGGVVTGNISERIERLLKKYG